MLSPQYLAGFFDGESYMGIMRHTHSSCKRGYGFNCAIKIAQSCRHSDIIIQLNKELGGNLDRVQKHRENQDDSLSLGWVGIKRVSKILDYIYPFLIIKKKQADVLKEFIKIKTPSTRKPGLVDIEMDAMYKQKQILYDKIILLNRRGKDQLQRLNEKTPS